MGSTDEQPTYRAHVDRAPIGVFEVDGSGAYLDVNPEACEMVGYSREELLGMSLVDLHPTAGDADTPPSFRAVKDEGRVRTEVELQHADGHGVDVLLDAVAIDDDRFVAYCRDISDRRRYERRLEEQRDGLEVLNQVLRHDVRNDLQLVTAYAERLAETCESAERRADAETILQNVDHAVELTTTVRDIAELMLSAPAERRAVDLVGALEAEIDEVRTAFPDAAITDETARTPVLVEADEMLGSVFRNLLKNAVQHNDTAVPEVTVSTTEREESVGVRVSDNGPGVPDEQKTEIFGKGEAGLESAGTGVGLYLVETLVEGYGGDVWVEDGDPEGSVFVVDLPKAT